MKHQMDFSPFIPTLILIRFHLQEVFDNHFRMNLLEASELNADLGLSLIHRRVCPILPQAMLVSSNSFSNYEGTFPLIE